MNMVNKRSEAKLPNPSETWGRDLPQFESWKNNKDYTFNSEDAALFIFLHELMRSEQVVVSRDVLSDIASAVTETETLHQCFIGELLYAYLALSVAGDSNPARLFVVGHRLCPGLHADYVHRTRCYG